MNFMEFTLKAFDIVIMGVTCVFESLFKDSNGNTSIIGHIFFCYLTLSLLAYLIDLAWDGIHSTGSKIVDQLIRNRFD